MVPGEDRQRTPVRAPGFRQFAQPLLGWPFGKAEDDAGLDLHGEVARGPDVGPSFGEEEASLRRPAADALDSGEADDRLLVVLRQRVEIEPVGEYLLREAARVGRLHAREAGAAQRLVAGIEEPLRRRWVADEGGELRPH